MRLFSKTEKCTAPEYTPYLKEMYTNVGCYVSYFDDQNRKKKRKIDYKET